MRKFFKWLFYITVLLTVVVVAILAIAYWNRDALLKTLSEKLNEGINGTVHIEKIDFTFLHNFPHFSVTLHNVYLRGEHYETYPQDVFAANRLFLDIRLYPLLKKEVIIRSFSVDEAKIFVFKSRNGYTNSDIFKTSSDSSDRSEGETSVLLNLQTAKFNNVSVVYSDSIKNKSMSFRFIRTDQSLSSTDSGYTVRVQGKMHFDGLLFNAKAGSFLSNKDVLVDLHLYSNKLTKHLTVHPSSLTFKKNVIQITGKFELKKEGNYALKFTSADLSPVEAKEILNTKLIKTLNKFKVIEPVTITVALSGKSIPGYIPDVDVEFQTRNATFHYGTLDFSKLSLDGSFTNHADRSKPNDNSNSKVVISSFSGRMEKIPVAGKVMFTELQDPVINLAFTAKVDYKDINSHLDNNRFILESGDFTSKVTYAGKLSEYLDPTRTIYQGKLSGEVQATNASMFYKPKKIRMDQIALRCAFNEKNFNIDALTLNMNGSPVKINGSMKNFIPFFIRPKKKGYVKLNVHSPNLDLTSLTAKRESAKKSKQQAKKDRKKLTDLLDMVYEKLEFDVDLKISQLTFRKFNASNFTGKVKLDNNSLEASPIKMDVANGTMNLNFSLSNVFGEISPMAIKARVDDANIKELFLNFNNFNQQTIKADNLTGTISADITFNANVDESYLVQGPSMRGSLDCKITNGGLKNFEPMEQMSNFLFKKRDFSDVQFAELYSNFSINGTDMDISRMEIQSSVLSLFLEGRYSFTDSTSLSVQIPLSNLKKRHKDFKPQNIGTHAKAGPSVFLHVYRDKDINSKIKIDYDPFKKWVNK